MPQVTPILGYKVGDGVTKESLFGPPIQKSLIESDQAKIRSTAQAPPRARHTLVSTVGVSGTSSKKTSSVLPVLAMAGIGLMILSKR